MGREAIEIGGRRVDQALRQVMALIHDGQFPPGARLPGERQLAESIGVSRPILREALNRLESRGLIERRSKSGNYVCTAVPRAVSTAVVGQAEEALISLADVVELRRVLEGWAVEKAAGNPDKKALAKLRTLVRTMQDTAGSSREEDFRRYQEADLAFHQVIAQMAHNLLYVHLLDLFADLVKRAIAASKLMVTDDFPMQNLARHRAILQALEAGDAARAREAMSRHFALLEERLPRRGRT